MVNYLATMKTIKPYPILEKLRVFFISLNPDCNFFYRIIRNYSLHLIELKPTIMEQLNFHKQKLYALIIALVAFISLLFPWLTSPFGGSLNGFRGLGLLSLFCIGAVTVLSVMGDKSKEFDGNSKKLVMGGFGAIAAGALLFLLTKNSSYGGGIFGSILKPGLGLWLCIIAGLAGLAFLSGIIKLPGNKPPTTPNS
jgi:hypothetical protein